MHQDSFSSPVLDHEKRERFLEFILSVSPSADPTSVFIFGILARVSRELMQAVEKHLATSGLSWAKFRLLLDLQRNENLGRKEGLQPSELSEMQGLSRNTLSALIASLEGEGFISRELHRTDRRKFVIRLTEKGREILNSKLDRELQFVTECFSSFTVAERETLYELLARLSTDISKK